MIATLRRVTLGVRSRLNRTTIDLSELTLNVQGKKEKDKKHKELHAKPGQTLLKYPAEPARLLPHPGFWQHHSINPI